MGTAARVKDPDVEPTVIETVALDRRWNDRVVAVDPDEERPGFDRPPVENEVDGFRRRSTVTADTTPATHLPSTRSRSSRPATKSGYRPTDAALSTVSGSPVPRRSSPTSTRRPWPAECVDGIVDRLDRGGAGEVVERSARDDEERQVGVARDLGHGCRGAVSAADPEDARRRVFGERRP